MIILNTINNDNKTIEYHFAHDGYKGAAFKILATFDAIQEQDEFYITCNYEQLDHNLNSLILSEDELKTVCDQFASLMLQTLLESVQEKSKVAGDEQC